MILGSYLVHPDLVILAGLTLGHRLKILGYLDQFPPARRLQGPLHFLKSAGLVYIWPQIKDYITPWPGDANQLIQGNGLL